MAMKLCECGKTDFRIVISKANDHQSDYGNDNPTRYAAEELTMFLFQATKTVFPIIFDTDEKKAVKL